MSNTLTQHFPILLVDDDEAVLNAISFAFLTNGITNIIAVSDSRKVLAVLEEQEVAFVLLDLSMPYFSGEQILEKIKKKYVDLPVIMATANDDTETVVSCMKLGAFDYIVKPIDTGRLLSAARLAMEFRELRQENIRLRNQSLTLGLKQNPAFSEIRTQNQKMFSIFRYIESIANSSQPVMITGETGSGKDLIARAIHQLSGRKGELVSVNVAGLDDNIFADALFGHAKGAYTGATSVRDGQVKKAAQGSLFLDEIGDLSMLSQVKLLRLVQEREYMPLGSDKPKYTDARIIVATHRDLDSLKDSGDFRKDLYFRLYSHQIHLPPLRERLEDLPILVEYFLELAAKELKKKKPTIPNEVYTLLRLHNFPGNIRELQALVFDAVSKHTSGVLSLETFRNVVASTSKKNIVETEDGLTEQSNFQLPTLNLKEARRLLVAEAMKRAEDNKTVAAQLLGVSRQAVSQYLRSKPTK